MRYAAQKLLLDYPHNNHNIRIFKAPFPVCRWARCIKVDQLNHSMEKHKQQADDIQASDHNTLFSSTTPSTHSIHEHYQEMNLSFLSCNQMSIMQMANFRLFEFFQPLQTTVICSLKKRSTPQTMKNVSQISHQTNCDLEESSDVSIISSNLEKNFVPQKWWNFPHLCTGQSELCIDLWPITGRVVTRNCIPWERTVWNTRVSRF